MILQRGHTPLHYVCNRGHVEVVEMLLKHGVDTEATDKVSTVPPSPLPILYHMMMLTMLLYLYVMPMHHSTVQQNTTALGLRQRSCRGGGDAVEPRC